MEIQKDDLEGITISSNNRAKGTARDIPDPLKRLVRQRCGYGCVICGLPLYEYEHMEGWAIVKRHLPEEITLLCDQHHKEKTNHWLPIEKVKYFNEHPINMSKKHTKPWEFHYYGFNAEVSMGSNTFKMDNLLEFTPVVLDGEPIIRITNENGNILIFFKFMSPEGKTLLHIENNEVIFSTENWDVEIIGKRLKIRKGLRKIILDITFSPPNKIDINHANITMRDSEFIISNIGMEYKGVRVGFRGCSWTNFPIGVAMGINLPEQAGCRLGF
ncbi:hypothetical protein LLQ46_00390 [Rouxiella badensis]|uniref:hypothetical protein n=1 Tax=Rouxiella badensis TaxID=1646377 RepID=UPI001D158B16|nr:hypothetical protein [Rouxiella badensis]MCC3745306.1 hypothetical protein [Rouxiella badensis]